MVYTIGNAILVLTRLADTTYDLFFNSNKGIYFKFEKGFFLRDDIHSEDASKFGLSKISSGYTNYTTVYDSITDGLSGSIVEFDEKKLADAIKKLIENDMLRTVYSNNLKEENKNINYNAERYLELMREEQERAW